VASDTTNGPLIALTNYSGEVLVKEGNLTAGWNNEWAADNAAYVVVASDPANGPLIGIVTEGTVTDPFDNEAYVKEGGLDAGWHAEYAGVEQLTVASDSVNGPLIGAIDTSGEALAKEGSLSAGWHDEYGNVAGMALGSDPVNGPLIAVQDIEDGPDGRLLVKTGALDAAWNVENTDVAPGAFDVSG
jgi:hypothetical protein